MRKREIDKEGDHNKLSTCAITLIVHNKHPPFTEGETILVQLMPSQAVITIVRGSLHLLLLLNVFVIGKKNKKNGWTIIIE